MPKESVSLANFNRGLISKLALARIDLKRVSLAASLMNNWTPRIFGSMRLRTGQKYLGSTAGAAYFLPFIFSTDDVADIEITDANVRIWIDDALMTRASVSTAVTNGTFDSDLTGWTDNDESGGTSSYKSGGYLSLVGDGTNYSKRHQKVTVSTADKGTEHALTIIVERGPVFFRVGSAIGANNYITSTLLDKGVHSLTLTPLADFYIEFKSSLKYEILIDSVVVESSGEVSITAPWAAADLSNIRFDQSGDIIFIACDGYQQYKIERRATRSWSVVRYYADDGPFRNINISSTTITSSALSGNVVLTASAPIFKTNHKEALFRITSVGQTVTLDISAQDTFTNVIEVTGTGSDRIFQVTRAGTWTATVTLQRSLTSSLGPWEDVTTYTTNATVSYDDSFDNLTVWYRIGIVTGDYSSGTAELTLDYALGSIEGVARITSDQYGWLSRTAAEANQWKAVIWSPDLSLFCAVSYDGTNRVMTSPDGITWTARSAAEANQWHHIIWSPALTLFCAVSVDGTNRVMTSPDGITWTARAAAEANQWASVSWSPSLALFCAVSRTGTNRVMTSPDGITWTSRSASEANEWLSVVWSPELEIFCAVAESGTNRVMTSPDGITWTARAAAEANKWHHLTWSPELSLFCAVSYDGTNRVMTSPDGITWTARVAPEANEWLSVTWSPELSLFCVIGKTGTSRVITSPDGVTWTSRPSSEQSEWHYVTWSPELSIFCAVADVGTNIVMTSLATDEKNVTAEVLTDFGKTDATADWYEGTWSDYRGWPTSVGFAEGRLFWAGKNKLDGSVSDGYYSFDDTVIGDSSPISRTIGTGPVDTINWTLSLQRLLLGSEGTEFVCKASAFEEPLTNTACTIREASTQGSDKTNAVKLNKEGIYVQRGGTRIMSIAISENGEYDSSDLTLLTPETTAAGIKRIAIQRQPDTRILAVLEDGTMAIGIYDRVEDVLGWFTYSTDGLYEDIVVTPGADGTGEDAVKVVVKRTINGETVRYFERFALEANCVGGTTNEQLDSYVLYSGAAVTTITGLTHLEAKTVHIWGDGVYHGTKVVSGGQITGLTTAVSEAVIGLTYTAQWRSTKLAYATGIGTALTQKKKVEHLGLIMLNTHASGVRYGKDFDHLYDLPKKLDGADVDDDDVHADYDQEPFSFGGSWDSDSRLCLQAVAPKPANIVAAIIPVETHDKY